MKNTCATTVASDPNIGGYESSCSQFTSPPVNGLVLRSNSTPAVSWPERKSLRTSPGKRVSACLDDQLLLADDGDSIMLVDGV